MYDARPSLDLSSHPGIRGLWVVCVVGRDFVPLQKSLLVGAEWGSWTLGAGTGGISSQPGCPFRDALEGKRSLSGTFRKRTR